MNTQDVHITLNNPQLEEALLRLANQHQQNLQEFVIDVLSRYVQEIEKPVTLKEQQPNFEEQLEIGREFMRDYHETFNTLAK